MTGRLEGRVALVTGASRGIGAAVAKALAAEGAEVILVARTQGALEEVDDAIRSSGGKAVLAPQDLRKFNDLGLMAGGILQRWGRLDILVGNAGVLGGLSPVGHFSPKSWQEAFDVNVHANWHLLRAFDPLLRLSPAGRAIFVTSGVASHPAPFWAAYAASKAALEAMIRTYAAEVAQSQVRVNLIDPGIVRSRLRAEAFPGENPATLRAPEEVAGAFVRLAQSDCMAHGELIRAD
jgi:NAD(P)-dependent dehydrogenase (short-subunit alcohol dehydrogenase family)